MYGAPFFCILSGKSIVWLLGIFTFNTNRRCCIMFADRAKVFIKSGKGGEAMFLSEENCMFLMAVLTAETAEEAAMLFSR